MKRPKFILRIGFQEWAVPHNKGLASVMTLLGDAIPIDADLRAREITLQYCDDDHPGMLSYSTRVSLERIPPGCTWKRKRKDGTVEILRPAALDDAPAKPAPARPRINGARKAPLQLEFR